METYVFIFSDFCRYIRKIHPRLLMASPNLCYSKHPFLNFSLSPSLLILSSTIIRWSDSARASLIRSYQFSTITCNNCMKFYIFSQFHKLGYVLFVLCYRIFTSSGNQQGMDRQRCLRGAVTQKRSWSRG